MRCGRCQAVATVTRHEVDGFVGYLCDSCRERWESFHPDTRGSPVVRR